MKPLSQRGETSMILVSLLALVLIGAATYFAYRQGQAHSLTLPSPTPAAQSVKLAHFRSALNTLSFDYPASWKADISIDRREPGFPVEAGSITSPDGLVIHLINPASGLGGACGDPCTVTTQTFFAERHQLVGGQPINIVEQKIFDPKNSAIGVQRRLGIVENDEYYQVDTKKPYVGYPPYAMFDANGISPTNTKANLIMMYADYLTRTLPNNQGDAKSSLSDTAYFNTPDMKTALTVFRSLKY